MDCSNQATHEDLVPYEADEEDPAGVAWTLCCEKHASPIAEPVVGETYKLHDLSYDEILARVSR